MAVHQLVFAIGIFLTTSEASREFANFQDLSQRVDNLERIFQEQVNKTIPGRRRELKPCPAEFYDHKTFKTCYRVMSDTKSWYEAREDCQDQGAGLVWFQSVSEYRHVVIKLLSEITAEKDYNNAGYWSGANDIIKGPLVWGDTDRQVQAFFVQGSSSVRYGYPSSSKSNQQKHCVFMKYVRETMRMEAEMSECDGGRLYICKCRRDTDDEQGCSTPSPRVKKSDD